MITTSAPSYEIDLDRAYAIRAEMVAYLNDRIDHRETMTEDEVITAIWPLTANLPRAFIEHLARRVMETWGIPGLDYDEAPLVPGSNHLRIWYPVLRDGVLQRIPIDDITDEEQEAIHAEIDAQAKAWWKQAGELRQYHPEDDG